MLLQLFNHLDKAAPRGTGGHVGKTVHVFAVAFFQHHVFGVFVAKQRDGIHRSLLQIAKGDDVAEGFGGIKNAVGARIRLHQPVVAQVFIDKQRVQPGRIKTRQKHAHHNQQINLLGFDLLGQIAVIVLKAVAVHAEIGFEQRVVIGNRCVQKLFGAGVHGRHLKALILNVANRVLRLVGGKRENGGHAQRLVAALLQRFEALVIQLGRIHAADGQHSVKAFGARFQAVGFLAVVAQDVLRNLADALGVQ